MVFLVATWVLVPGVKPLFISFGVDFFKGRWSWMHVVPFWVVAQGSAQFPSCYGVRRGFASYPQVSGVAWCLLNIELSSVNGRNSAVTF